VATSQRNLFSNGDYIPDASSGQATLFGLDRAKLRLVRQIPDAGYNRDVEIEATTDGIVIDNYTTIPWHWIIGASARLGLELSDTSRTAAPVAPESSAS
jgi:hypothetical protein